MMFNATLDIGSAINASWGGTSFLNRDGVGSIRTTWMASWADDATLSHETGHGFGLSHSWGGYGSAYGSPWDVMSSAGGTCELYDGQTPGWGSIPIAFANGDGTWNITNSPAGPDFIPSWANQPWVQLAAGSYK